jgi:hypothetical protein
MVIGLQNDPRQERPATGDEAYGSWAATLAGSNMSKSAPRCMPVAKQATSGSTIVYQQTAALQHQFGRNQSSTLFRHSQDHIHLKPYLI